MINENAPQGANQNANIEHWVKNGVNKALINWADNFARSLVTNGLKTNQIRNVFGEVKRIQLKHNTVARKVDDTFSETEDFNERDIIILIPKLAYVAKKAKNNGAKNLALKLTEGLNAVLDGNTEDEKKEAFENFVKVFESILAYHKAHGGDN